MEEVLVLVLQLLFEFVVQLLIYGGLDIAAWSIKKNDESGGVGCGVMVLFLFLGVCLAFLANVLHPRPFLPQDWMRILNLIAGAPLAGGASWLFAEWRRRTFGAQLAPSLHFWFAFWFVLGFDLVRFIYAQH